MDSRRIILRSLFTEKSTRQQDASNQYVFAVDPRANKRQIADAIEQLFEVKVLQVRTQNRMGKIHAMGRYSGRRADWKKAIVTLAEGNSIEMYENL
ncbi:MAG TPA: 50S ribosomal protein L23 [Gemmatimonadota bacterium]|jgi:large subunit ribosomal protein L23|nr:50S ribosomal protein L23 [Gemmatimonadota bacterium]